MHVLETSAFNMCQNYVLKVPSKQSSECEILIIWRNKYELDFHKSK